jgi:hypothetical protein
LLLSFPDEHKATATTARTTNSVHGKQKRDHLESRNLLHRPPSQSMETKTFETGITWKATTIALPAQSMKTKTFKK